MAGITHTHEFIRGRCAAARDVRQFIDDWITTNRNPCSVCQNDKSKCRFYLEAIKGESNEEPEDPA
jgi:hypothetical protein